MTAITKNTVYYDLAVDGSKTPTNDIQISENEGQVLQSLIDILNTQPGEKIYKKALVGCDLKQFLFEPIDKNTALRMLDVIETAISKYEPRAKNVVITIQPKIDENTYNIKVECVIDQSDRALTLESTLEELR